ncbi:MFS transporter [Cohnella sp. CFH 77786]|uniref:MFS transporter n=1 Tax=Cohnella sp. CFH 77786 TaxID=2662265 RepID=UPI001C60C0B6|nr:MFS transporter [Cohnella sp. CFH 77786]MBW5444477.1 MFS transporter [Cohnella sp. CFH 77786]
MNKRLLNSPITYAFGMFAMMVPSHAFSAFLQFYYVDVLGLTAGLFAIGKTIYSIWDAVNNPMMGYWSDRTNTRYGRRKPWIAVAIPLFVASFIFSFSPPAGLGQTGLFIWLVAGFLLFEGIATILWVNYGALFPELFKGDRLRAKASAVQQGFQILAILLASVLGPMIYEALGYGKMSIILSLIFALFMILLLVSVREDEEARKVPPLKFTDAFRETLKNKEFWIFNIANSFAQTVNGLLGAMIPFYAKYVLHIPGTQVSVLLASVFVPVIPLVAVWYMIVRKFGGLISWRFSFLVYGLSAIPLWFGTNLGSGIAAGIVVGFGLAGFLVTPAVLSGQIVDRDAERTGRRREGIYSAVGGFITRSSGLISAVAFWIVGMMYGYVNGDNPGPNPETAFRVLICVVPICLLAISFFISLLLKDDLSSSAKNQDRKPGLPIA